MRLQIADLYRFNRKLAPADTPHLIAAVADAGDLPERHPLRIRALLAQANAAAAQGDLAAAAAAFARAGLSEQQCALIAKTRYVRSYRPEASMACAANQQAFRFILPK